VALPGVTPPFSIKDADVECEVYFVVAMAWSFDAPEVMCTFAALLVEKALFVVATVTGPIRCLREVAKMNFQGNPSKNFLDLQPLDLIAIIAILDNQKRAPDSNVPALTYAVSNNSNEILQYRSSGVFYGLLHQQGSIPRR